MPFSASSTPLHEMLPTVTALPLSMQVVGVSGDAQIKPANPRSIVWDLPEGVERAELLFDLGALKIRPRDYDEIHIRFKPHNGEVMWSPELTAYPVKGLRRHWYSKFPLRQNEWQTARFDLAMDDDGWWVGGPSDLEKPALNLVLLKQWQRVPGEAKSRSIEIESVQFVRRVVAIDFDEMAARPLDTQERLGWAYDLVVTNRETAPVEANLRLDTGRLHHFHSNWKTKTVHLKPRESRRVPIELTMSRQAAKDLPGLYSEPVQAFVSTPDSKDLEITPLRGYRPRYLWATVPPRQTPQVTAASISMEQAEAALGQDWAVPTHGPAAHPQGYYNAATSKTPVPLTWFRHRDPETGEILTDDKYNLAYIHRIHEDNFKRTNLLADAFVASGELRFAAAARDVLLEYARQYPFLRPSAPDATSGRSRLGLNTLMSSYLFPQACDAYTKIRFSPALSDSDRKAIESDFIRPETLAIYLHDVEYSNQQAEHYKATLHAAYALDYWPLAGEALYGDHGFFAMVEHAFSADGISHEAGAYHWSTLAAMLECARFLDARGITVMNQRFKRVFDGMVAHSPQGIYENALAWPAFDFAYRIYRDPRYIPTLKAAMLWPPPYLTPQAVREAEAQSGTRLRGNSLLPNVGYLWLREESPQGFRALSINYIAQWDRAEYDRLHYSLFDETGRLTSEVSRIIYSAPEAETMYETSAHNSIVVDGQNQHEVPSRLAQFFDRSSLPAALITEIPQSPLYPGVQMARVVALIDGIYFIGDLLHSETARTYDWPLYLPWQPGQPIADAAITTSLPLQPLGVPRPLIYDTGSYHWLTEVTGALSSELLQLRAPAPNKRVLHVTLAPMPNALLVKALGPRGYRPKPGPVQLVRQEKRTTAKFGAAFDLTAPGAESAVHNIEVLPLQDEHGNDLPEHLGVAWRVSTITGNYIVAVNRSGKPVKAASIAVKDELCVERLAAG